jgi:hypothetical protein
MSRAPSVTWSARESKNPIADQSRKAGAEAVFGAGRAADPIADSVKDCGATSEAQARGSIARQMICEKDLSATI